MPMLLKCRRCNEVPYVDRYYSSTHHDMTYTYECKCPRANWHIDHDWWDKDPEIIWNNWVQHLDRDDSLYYSSIPQPENSVPVSISAYFLPCKFCNKKVTSLWLHYADDKRRLRTYQVRCGCSAPWVLFEHYDDHLTAIELDWNEMHGEKS